MVAAPKSYLGAGLYTVAEAAVYARVSTAMMTRWLFGSSGGRPVIDPEYGPKDRVVSFLDLVQTLAIREIRFQKKVPLPKFRQAIKLARDQFGLDHPFARRHCTYLLGDELVIRPTPDEFVEASGRHAGQRLFPFVELYLADLTFDASGLATKYRIYQSPHAKPVAVTMDPRLRFGEPLLPSGYTPAAVWDAIRAEGGIDPAAKALGVPPEEAEAAYRFYSEHLNKTAA